MSDADPQQPQPQPQRSMPPGAYLGPDGTAWVPYIPPQKTNVLSIVAFAGSFAVPPAGLICGILALKQTEKTGEKGRGFALAGIIIGSIYTLLILLSIILSLFAILFVDAMVAKPTDNPAQHTFQIHGEWYGENHELDALYDGCKAGAFEDCTEL